MLRPTLIVPARLASQRFPRKLLHPIHGKPLILHTAGRLRNVAAEFPLYFAVDGPEIGAVLQEAGFNVIETDPQLASGSDRIAAANLRIGADYVINVQADEPLVSREHILALTELLAGGAPMVTLACPFEQASDFADPNQVKVAINREGRALYFSRAPIPHPRDSHPLPEQFPAGKFPLYRHIGLYGYQANFLQKFTQLPPALLESTEKLEQLRALENGYPIQVGITTIHSIGIDTPQDATRLEINSQLRPTAH